MKVNVYIFGQLTDITGTDSLELEEVTDTDTAVSRLKKQYPALADKSFIIAVDEEVVNSNTLLRHESTLALLPPYSGG